MNEYEIRRALAGAAPATAPAPSAPDPDRLRAALVRADRLRTVQAALAVGAVSLVAGLGLFLSSAGESAAPTDVVGIPDSPPPEPAFALVDVPAVETTTTQPAEPAEPAGAPAHLDADAPPPSAPDVITVTTTRSPDGPAPTVPATTPSPPPTTTPPTSTTVPTTTTVPATTTTGGTIEFHASALYGSCEEPIPYDEYSGTAAAGATITVSSAWSTTATTTADANGDWWIRVEFPTAPVGETFSVHLTDGSDHADLDFIRTA